MYRELHDNNTKHRQINNITQYTENYTTVVLSIVTEILHRVNSTSWMDQELGYIETIAQYKENYMTVTLSIAKLII